AGFDTFLFAIGDGHDTISDFGAGVDRIEVDGFSSYTLVQEGAHLRVVFDANNSILLQNFPQAAFQAGDITFDVSVITGTADDDMLVGTADADTIFGLGGYDRLIGGDGADLLYGGDGGDVLSGGGGDDLIDGGDGLDTVDFGDATSG